MTAVPRSSGRSAANPYTAQPTGDPSSRLVATAPAGIALGALPVTGPSRPPGGVPALAPHRRLARTPASAQVGLHWTGAHGGAGVDTLTSLITGSASLGRAWPLLPRGAAPTVLVARTSYLALRALQDALTDWAWRDPAGGRPSLPSVALVGVAVIADAPGKLPRDLRKFAEIVTSGAPRVWELPWVEAWRCGGRPDLDTAPGQYRRLAADLVDLVPALRGGQYPCAPSGSLL